MPAALGSSAPAMKAATASLAAFAATSARSWLWVRLCSFSKAASSVQTPMKKMAKTPGVRKGGKTPGQNFSKKNIPSKWHNYDCGSHIAKHTAPGKNCRACKIFQQAVHQLAQAQTPVAKRKDKEAKTWLCGNLSQSLKTKNKTKHVTGFCICSNQTKKSSLPTSV